MEERQVKISDLQSKEDVDKVEQALKDVWGVRNAEVSLERQEAKFSYNENSASYDDFVQALKDSGFSIQE
ncbi:copper chaperone CopZ [Pullulanibacillus pueri]|uniref:HMA domain-containing protein n=1 Tax=Pullulanibacillus pueri TaxID=1437324 RepID=A0A8J3ENE9_9BACL|nr:heavy metal-associated domain-containing protein [Pullulanibacillus pueri]MBM7681022.1 copper chaperone CopZ [Pullulanibacillus pueri]GGH86326.1 hypothetical protein GCM10007096_33780 [Pullulanibacillus pueri]